ETVPIREGSKKIRVFPLTTSKKKPLLRTNQTYDTIMKIYDNLPVEDQLKGHAGHCVLRPLKYFDVGTSFLSDSLHNVCHGLM
ncbi:unnamed protein product, partial [Didymodactylos carnosus]